MLKIASHSAGASSCSRAGRASDAGVVYQDVHPSVGLAQVHSQGIDAGEIGHVTDNAFGAMPVTCELKRDLPNPRLIPTGEDDRCVHRRQLAGNRVTDTATASGYDSDQP